jgi:hypothetical protein
MEVKMPVIGILIVAIRRVMSQVVEVVVGDIHFLLAQWGRY